MLVTKIHCTHVYLIGLKLYIVQHHADTYCFICIVGTVQSYFGIMLLSLSVADSSASSMGHGRETQADTAKLIQYISLGLNL